MVGSEPQQTMDDRIEIVARIVEIVCSDGNSDRYRLAREILAALDAARPAPSAVAPKAPHTTPGSIAPWEHPQVQLVYDMLCDDVQPPNPEEHWEGWLARRIVAALSAAREASAGQSAQDGTRLLRHLGITLGWDKPLGSISTAEWLAAIAKAREAGG